MNLKCWTKSLGNCAAKLSREHLFSQGLFDEPELIVRGYPPIHKSSITLVAWNIQSKVMTDTTSHTAGNPPNQGPQVDV